MVMSHHDGRTDPVVVREDEEAIRSTAGDGHTVYGDTVCGKSETRTGPAGYNNGGIARIECTKYKRSVNDDVPVICSPGKEDAVPVTCVIYYVLDRAGITFAVVCDHFCRDR
jgi:hypothetical protein